MPKYWTDLAQNHYRPCLQPVLAAAWGYTYDRMNRLKDADFFPGPSLSPALFITEKSIAYDLNGNITALKRYGSSGLENELSFTHSGNRMTALTDAQATGSEAGPKTFTYDANGNLTYDGRQDLDIQWNIFNLASGAETHDGGSLTLARLSDGTLFSQQKVSGGNTTGKRYCGSFVFTTGTGNTTPQVESVAWDEGRIFADAAGNYHDCWFAGDHLGNIRSVLDITPDVTVPIPLEQNDYLPFGTKISNPLHAQMNTNRWRYAGKEEFPDLNLLDFGARMYDPFMARWTAVDPLAEKYTSMSPYMYCAGDPVCVYDPNGRMANPIYTSDGTYKGTTIEGFTGAVIIYNGDKEFSKITALELLNDEGAHTYDQVRDALSGEVKAKIWTHLVSQMDGLQVYDETFSLTTLSDGKIGFSSTANGSWNSNLNLKTITGTDKYNYETTVENILSSIIVHEWYSHIMKGNRDAFESHRLAYKNVINYKPFWEGSTDAYKGFNLRELLLYTKKETGRTKVDPLYRRLYKRYNEVY